MVYAALGDGRRLLKDCNAVAVLYSLLKKEQSGTRLAERTGLRKCEDFFGRRRYSVRSLTCDYTVVAKHLVSDFFATKNNSSHSKNILILKIFRPLLL